MNNYTSFRSGLIVGILGSVFLLSVPLKAEQRSGLRTNTQPIFIYLVDTDDKETQAELGLAATNTPPAGSTNSTSTNSVVTSTNQPQKISMT